MEAVFPAMAGDELARAQSPVLSEVDPGDAVWSVALAKAGLPVAAPTSPGIAISPMQDSPFGAAPDDTPEAALAEVEAAPTLGGSVGEAASTKPAVEEKKAALASRAELVVL
eukprot:9266517-Pyramimonas_sp.AAC.1